MAPVQHEVMIGQPREAVFAYLSDIANLPEFCDHFLVDWHLTREDTVGRGAGARFRAKVPFGRFTYADITYTQVEPPYRIAGQGRGGKANVVAVWCEFKLSAAGESQTRVELTIDLETASPPARVMLGLGFVGWLRGKSARALRRLRAILEEGEQRGQRATLAGR